jgi:hypothetical protein
VHLLERDTMAEQARNFCRQGFEGVSPRTSIDPALVVPEDTSGRLWAYFTANNAGPGIWKWTHYFDIYQRHLGKFVGRDAHIGAASRCQTGRLRGVRLGFWFPRQWTTGSDTEKQVHRLPQSNHVTDQGSNNTFGACYPGARRILLTRKTVKTGPDPFV